MARARTRHGAAPARDRNGATAVRAVFGKAMPIGRNRGRLLDLDEGAKGLITIHPSYLLRVEEEDREREYLAFVADLRLAKPFTG